MRRLSDNSKDETAGDNTARIFALIFLIPLFIPIFGMIAALPIEAVVHSGLVTGVWKKALIILQLIVTFVFGLLGTIWVSKKIWNGMGKQDSSI